MTGVGVGRAAGAMGEQKAVIKDTDMAEEMQQQAVQCALRSLEEQGVEFDVAARIKRVKGRPRRPA